MHKYTSVSLFSAKTKLSLAKAGCSVGRGRLISPGGTAWMHNRSIQQIGRAQ